MSTRQERIAANETSARAINEQIDQAHDGQPGGRFLRVVCECGLDACERVVAITIEEYRQVRRDPEQFVVTHGHEMPEAEVAVAGHERFAVVAKRGVAGQIAREDRGDR